MHVGWDNPKKYEQEQLILAMDVFLGCPSIEKDSDTLRRKLYGKPGAFRPKKYGVEYRTLSNFWIQSKDHMGWVFEQTQKALDFLREGNVVSRQHRKLVHDCILNGNKDSLNHIKGLYPV